MKRKQILPLILFIVFLIIGVICISVIVLNCAELENPNRDLAEIIINIAVGVCSLLGTVCVSVMAFRMSQRANEISEAALKKDFLVNLQIQKEVGISRLKINDLKRVVDFSNFFPTEGAYCQKENEDSHCVRIRLYFKALKAPPSHMRILSCGFNSLFALSENRDLVGLSDKLQEYCVIFKILNTNNNLCFAYDPSTEMYKIELYLFASFETLSKINDAGYLVLDFELEVDSVFGEKQNIIYFLNFEHINGFSELQPGKLENHSTDQMNVELCNVIFYEVE